MSSKVMPGGLDRRGPVKETGLARSDQTGSIMMLRAVPCSVIAWPTKLMRRDRS
ncbi:hypothetical protein [Roseomonas sp. WA12]